MRKRSGGGWGRGCGGGSRGGGGGGEDGRGKCGIYSGRGRRYERVRGEVLIVNDNVGSAVAEKTRSK